MSVCVSSVCGYACDPVKSDPEGCVVPGTLFESLPENRLCPVCDAKTTRFFKP